MVCSPVGSPLVASARVVCCKQKMVSCVPDESDCKVGMDICSVVPSWCVKTPEVRLTQEADKTISEKRNWAPF